MLNINAAKLIIILLVVIQLVTLSCVVMKLKFKLEPIVSKQNKTQILILSSWRSGSSFTGQLFNQHPNVFYLMEPAWHVWNSLKTNVQILQMVVRDFLRSLFLCDMSVFDAYMPKQRIKLDLFQWDTSRALCSSPACKHFNRYDNIVQSSCRILCGKYPFDTIEKACKTYSHIVVKEVRVFDLTVLFPLLRDPSLNLKILHLVRDPRAVFQSREKTEDTLSYDSSTLIGEENNKKKDAPYRVMEKICKSQVEMYKAATNITNRLHGRYMMVRYEDIAKDPVGKARQMYEFANLNFTSKLRDWVYDMTHGMEEGNNFVITSRDAVNISKAWRMKLPFETVQQVQDICKEALNEFGFRSVLNATEQKDLDLNLVLPVPQTDTTAQSKM